MSKIAKPWEAPLSSLIPYLAWGGLAAANRSCWTTARHSNTCYELHIILEGTCTLDFDDQTFRLVPGQAVMIAPNVFHAPGNVSASFCRFSLSFSVDPALKESLQTVDTAGYRFFEPDQQVLAVCRNILLELDASDFLNRELLSALFSQLMILCLRSVRGQSAQSSGQEKPATQEDEIERIDNFFALYPPERQTRQELAEYLHCSQRQLIRKMQTLYGVSFRQKLINSRMDLARYLLRSTDASVNEISTRVGYADNAAFFRAFRQHTGMTPAQYRKEKRKG
jgi:AraC-like DNA-binding protein